MNLIDEEQDSLNAQILPENPSPELIKFSLLPKIVFGITIVLLLHPRHKRLWLISVLYLHYNIVISFFQLMVLQSVLKNVH